MDRCYKPWMVLLLVTSNLLWGCSAARVHLKEQPSGILNFSVEESYDTVFQRVANQAKQCYEAGGRHIEAHLFRDKEMAEVVIAIVHLGTSHTLLTAEIKAISPNSTQVNTYHGYSPPGAWRDGAYTVQRWATSKEPYCPR